MSKIGDVFMPNIMSQYDVSSIVENLVEIRRRFITKPINERKELIEQKSEAISTLRKLALDLLSASQGIASTLSYNVFRANLKNLSSSEDPKNILGVSLGPDAVQGYFDMVVNQTAQAWKVSSSVINSADATLGSLGVSAGSKIIIKGTDTANARSLEVNPNWTIKQFRDKLNELGTGLSAYIQNVSGGVQLVISASKTGTKREYITIVDASGNAFQQLGFFSSDPDIVKNQSGGSALSDAFTRKEGTGSEIGKLLGFAPGTAPSGTVRISGINVLLDLNTMTLEDIKNTINSAVGSGTAEIVQEGNIYRLKINSLDLDDNGSTVLKTLGILTKNFQNVITPGQNARITVDGTSYTSQDNVFTPDETGIAGVTFNAIRASSDIIQVSVTRDVDRIMKYLNDFVEAWNKVINFLNEQVKFNEKTGRAGPLSGDPSISATRAAMRRTFSGLVEVGQPDGSVKVISITNLGFSIDREGRLSLDQAKLSEALRTDFETTVRALTSAVTEKLASATFASETTPLGLSGEILVDGKSVVVTSSDTLKDIALKINAVSASVRAYVKTVGADKKLIVERVSGGLPNLAEIQGNLLVSLGLASSTALKIKNQVSTTSVRTDVFFSATAPVRNSVDSDTSTPDTENNIVGNLIIPLHGGGTVTVTGINISTDSLSDIVNKINTAAGIEIASLKGDGTKHQIEIAGVKTEPSEWGGNLNLLQFLGILKREENKTAAKLGFGEHIRREIGDLLSSKGAIEASKDRIETELTGIDKRLAKIEEEIEAYRVSLYERWARANQLIAYTRNILNLFQSIAQQLIKGVRNPFLTEDRK